MSRRCRNYCDDSDSDVDMSRSGRASRSAASRKGGEFGIKGRKEQSRPWSQEESDWLIQVVSKNSSNLDNINWQDVAKQVPGRTGKQCREKWKNDLRPNICKEPWSLKEEYVLAVAHSMHGNRWSEVAKYLPTRPENTIKNRWYATNRAKAEVKIRTFLWLYSDLVDRQSYPAGPEAIDKARELYRQLPDVVPLEEFEVPVDFYIARSESGCQAALDTRPEIKIIGRGKAKPHVPGATTVGGGGGGGGSSAAAAAVLSAVRGAAAAASANRFARAGAGVCGGSAAVATVAASAATAAGAAAAATVAVGSSGKGRSGDSGGGGHSEGDANCYVKVGGLAGELPAVGVVKNPTRKRKGPGFVEGESASPAVNAVHKVVKVEAAAQDGLGAGVTVGSDTSAAISTRSHAVPADDLRSLPMTANHMAPPLPASLVVPSSAGSVVASATTVTTGAGRAGGNGGDAAATNHAASALDPELLWQTAIEPYSNQNNGCNNIAVSKGHRIGASRSLGAVRSSGVPHMHPAAVGPGIYGVAGAGVSSGPGARTHNEGDNLQSLFASSGRMAGSEGGASSAADLALFPLGPGALNGLLEDHDGTAGPGGAEADQDLLALTDGLDLASLTALIGPHEVHGEAADCAHEAMAGLAEDVLSQMPESATRMAHHHAHHAQHGSQRVSLTPPHTMGTNSHPHSHPHLHQHQQQHQHQQPAHQYSQQQLAPPMRHASSMGSAQQQQQRQQQQQQVTHHTHSMSQGSYPLHPQQPLMQSHEVGCNPSQQQQQQQQQQSGASRPGAPHQQQQLQGPNDINSTQMHQQQQQQQALSAGAHDVTGGQQYLYPRRLPAGAMTASSRPPAATAPAAPSATPPPHHPMAQHPMYGGPPYMPHPHPHSHTGVPPPTTPGQMMQPNNGGSGRPMLPSGPAPSPVKYSMATPYTGPPPPGAPYAVSGPPPPPYMISMGMRGGYYKMPGGRMPGVMPRSMMPYPPPYGMSVYSSHVMPPAYMESTQPAMGPAGDSAVHHSQQGLPMEPCSPAGAMGSSMGAPMRSGNTLSQGGGAPSGPGGSSVEPLASLGMGRTYGDIAPTGPTAPGPGQGM